MTTLKDLLGEKYKDELTKEELTAFIEAMNLTDTDSDTFKASYLEKSAYDKAKLSFDKTASELAALKREKQSNVSEAEQLKVELAAIQKKMTQTDFERKLAKGGFDDEAIADIVGAFDSPTELAEKYALHTQRMV
jgi:hypothetical protein